MGESSVCLMRSFSQPSPSSADEKKGNHLQRALTTSISFGRFMSESLDWEKWSAFTHNRYLEEVEKYSKPGSVAEKKAYFEAHFKRRRAAALLEQQNAAANDLSQTNTEIKVKDNSSLDSDSAKDGEVQPSDPILPVGQHDLHDASIEKTSEDGLRDENEKVIKSPEKPVELATHLENDECVGDIVSKEEDKVCNEDESTQRNSLSSSEKKPEVSSSKLSTNGGASKCAPSVKPIIPIQIKNSNKTPDSNQNDMDSSNKRRSYTTSLHMSINFATCSDENQKATSTGHSGLQKIGNSRIIRAPAKKYKNSSMLPQTATRASVNNSVVLKHQTPTPPAENKRSITHQGDLNSGRRTVDWKVPSVSPMHSKSSNTFEGKARLPTVSSPFTFKSEERAAKRKEFFQKLEEKLKSRETEKHELHAKTQVQTRTSFKDLRNAFESKATRETQVPSRKELPSSSTTKIPTVRPLFPIIEERASLKVRDSDSRPPWRISIKTVEGLKDVMGKNSHHQSSKCFLKNSNENASPNIRM